MNPNNSRYLKRLIILYTTLIIVILIMGAYLYNISIKNVSHEIRTQNKLSLEKTIHDLDTSLRTMDLLAGQMVTNSNLVQLANKENNESNDFYIKAYHAINEMSVYVHTESTLPIKAEFIYLNQPNYIISSSQFTDSELFYTGTKSYTRDMYDQWMTLLNKGDNYRTFLPIDQFKSFSDSTYLYLLPLTEYTIKDVPATLCFEFDYDRLKEIFSELNYHKQGYLYVTNENNTFAFDIKGDEVTSIPTDVLTQLSYDNGYSTIKDSHSDMFVTTSSSDYNSWHYYLVQPSDASLYSLAQYRNLYITIILIALFIEILMIIYLSRSNVKKITQLGTQLQDTLSEQETLQKLVDRQKPIIMQSYLFKIMEGQISTTQELDYARHYLNIPSNLKKFSILHIVAYVNQYELNLEGSAVTVPDTLDFTEIIQQSIADVFDNSLYVISKDERAYSVLISSPSDESPDVSSQTIAKAFNTFHNHLKEVYSIWTFAGLGDWNNSLMASWKSYQQATQSVSYATKRKKFCCYANMERDTNTFYYPIELTKQLNNFITTGNESQVLEIFEIIRHENMEVRSLPIHLVKYLLSDIRNTLHKIRFTIKASDDNHTQLQSFDTLIDEHMSLKLYEDLALKLCHIFENQTSGNKQIATIKQYINDNYRDPSLCLNKISDEFDISESYFSYLFKEEIGKNFSSYLEGIRLDESIRLLTKTTMTISDIYDKVGYNNSHTFRRAFKKVYGMSPKEVRQS